MGRHGRVVAAEHAARYRRNNRVAWPGIHYPIRDEFKSERSHPSGRALARRF